MQNINASFKSHVKQGSGERSSRCTRQHCPNATSKFVHAQKEATRPPQLRAASHRAHWRPEIHVSHHEVRGHSCPSFTKHALPHSRLHIPVVPELPLCAMMAKDVQRKATTTLVKKENDTDVSTLRCGSILMSQFALPMVHSVTASQSRVAMTRPLNWRSVLEDASCCHRPCSSRFEVLWFTFRTGALDQSSNPSSGRA